MGEAEEAREDAISQVTEHADTEWLGLAVRAIRYTAKQKAYFTTDDIWDLLKRYEIPEPREPRAMAAAIRRAQDERIIHRTQEYASSARKESHARPKRIWASMIVEKEIR